MADCTACGEPVVSEAHFCQACGAPQDEAPAPDDALFDALQAALDELSRILADLQAGHIEPEAAQQRAFRSGLVVHDDRAWMLDVVRGCWFVYDGLRLEPASSDTP